MIKYRKTEREILISAYKRIKKRSTIDACCDAPLLGRCADLVYIAKNKLFSVEFKLKDWKKAIKQARDHRLGADYAYICMPERKVSVEMREEIRRSGLGLIFYRKQGRWPFKEIIKAPKSIDTWKIAYINLRRYVLSKQSGKRRERLNAK